MANEATVQSMLRINNGSLLYQSLPASFTADVNGTKGPSPGNVLVAVTGTTISLSQVGTPGLARLQNLDEDNFVTVGVYDGASFYPLLELGPGETFVMRLSRYVNLEFVGTGTNADTNQLRMMADTAACQVLVEVFER